MVWCHQYVDVAQLYHFIPSEKGSAGTGVVPRDDVKLEYCQENETESRQDEDCSNRGSTAPKGVDASQLLDFNHWRLKCSWIEMV